MELINLAGIALLALLIRKLVWCLRWLWCYYHGKETPEPVSFLPRRTEPQPPAADGEAWKVPGEKETAEEQTPSAMTCPWCGQEMRMGYLVGGRDAVRLVWERPGAFRLADADGTLYLRGDGSFWSDYKLAWHCGACRKLVLDTANCTRAEHLTSEEINRRIIYGADAEHLSESREEE